MLDDSDDEWYLNSIRRYKELIMFDTGDPVFQMELCDKRRICTLSERGPSSIISVLNLPSKLTRDSPGHILKQNCSDLKIASGLFPKSNPTQILSVYEKERLVASQEDMKGVAIYILNDSDQITLESSLSYPLGNPSMSLLDESRLGMSKYTRCECIVGDIASGSVTWSVRLEDTNDSVNPTAVDSNLLAFSLRKACLTLLYDLRDNSPSHKIDAKEGTDLYWSTFADYAFYKKTEATSNLYFLSKTGHFRCYDLRNVEEPLVKCQLPLKSKMDDVLKIRFNPENKDVLSVSGFDDSVYLYNIKNDMTEVFRHDGHSKTELCAKETTVSDHMWYSDEFVISGAFNNSINCWIANVNFNNIVV